MFIFFACRSFGRFLTGIAPILLILSTATLSAQTAGTGNIQGTVSDSTGAVVTNASVTLTDNATRVAHTTATSQSGLYSFPNIAIGTYTLDVSAPGFKKYLQSGITLSAGAHPVIDIRLDVGAIGT